MRAKGGSPASVRCWRKAEFGLLACLLLAACQRETRNFSGSAWSLEAPAAVQVSALRPGGSPAPAPDPRLREYHSNAYDISQGGQLYRWFNCSGCHFQGGGGIGPALMDESWRYGGSLDQIYASIADGRPNGMPAWGGKIPPQQIWQIAAYVRSLSGNADKSALGARYDELTGTPAATQTKAQKPRMGDPASVQGGS